jgi:hypothetical protein
METLITPEEALREVWAHTNNKPRSTAHRLELIFRTATRVLEQGPDTEHKSELNLDKALSAMGIHGILTHLADWITE